jgi:hypothetical protein
MNAPAKVALGLFVAAGALTAYILLNRESKPAPMPATMTLAAPAPTKQSGEPAANGPTVVAIASTPAAPAPSPTPVRPPGTPDPRDPENQPRSFLVRDFRNLDALPAGFKLEGIQLTPDGFQLLPPEAGKENLPRQGVLYSPSEPLDFPSNAVTPLWLENLPDGTDMFAEFQVSPDGETWGPWQWVVVDEDSMGQMSPTMHDGSPNPNAEFTPGGIYHWGDLQYQFTRYRFTLTSESAESPTLGAFRMFYQDSTLGEGQLAQPNVNIPTPTPVSYTPPADDVVVPTPEG